MDFQTFTTLMLQHRSRLDGVVRELVGHYEFEAAAETFSPANIGKSYGMGLDAVQGRLPNGLQSFDRAAESMVSQMNIWIDGVQRAHFDYIRAMKNPDFSLRAGDVMRAFEYASDPSAAKFLLDFVATLGKNFLLLQPDIRRSSNYLSLVQEFDNQVQPFIYGPLWKALSADLR